MINSLNVKTIVQALSILEKELNENNYMALIKHVFFSDRYHLRHYGFLYTFDIYYALKFGAVPSTTKDIITLSPFLSEQISEDDFGYLKKSIEFSGEHSIIITETSESHLSESIKEALNFSIRNFHKLDQYKLGYLTHDYPEWKIFEHYFSVNKGGRREMDISLFFEDPEPDGSPYIKKYLKGLDPYKEDKDFLREMKEEFLALDTDY